MASVISSPSYAQKLAKQLLSGAERYCLIKRRHYLPVKAVLVWLHHSVEVMQILVFVIPAEPELGLPWNYDLLGIVWTVLAFIFRPDYLFTKINCPADLVLSVYSSLILLKLVVCGALMIGYSLVDECRFEILMYTNSQSLLSKWMFLMDEVLSFILFRLLHIPIVVFLTRETTDFVIGYVILAINISLKLLDANYIGSISWTTPDIEASITSSMRVWFRGILIFVFCICSKVTYLSRPLFYPSILAIIGGYVCFSAIRMRPFHDERVNAWLLVKSLLVGWGGVCILLARFVGADQASLLSTLLFFLCFPWIFLLCLHQSSAARRSQIKIHSFSPLFDLKLKLEQHLNNDSEATAIEIDSDFRVMFLKHPREISIVIWALLYYEALEDETFVQVNLSRLTKMPWPASLYMDCSYTNYTVRQWLKRRSQLEDVIKFLEFQSAFQQIMLCDLDATKCHFTLFAEMSQWKPDIPRVLKLAKRMADFMLAYKATFRKINQKYKNNSVLLHLFSHFYLEMTNSRRALLYNEMKNQADKRQEASKYEEIVNDYNPNTMIFAVCLEPEDFGKFVWVRSASLLGYTEEELVGVDHAVIIPSPVKELHMEKLLRIQRFRHHHPVYSNVHGIIFQHKSGNLIHAYWKVRLVNFEGSGNLAVLCSIKSRENGPSIAFVDDAGKEVTAMTHKFHKSLSAILHQDIPHSFALKKVFGKENGTWTLKAVLITGSESPHSTILLSVRCESVNFYGRQIQKILVLVKRDMNASIIEQQVVEDNEPEAPETRRVDFTDFVAGTETAGSTNGPYRTKSSLTEAERITVSMKSKASSLFTSYNSNLKSLQVSVQSHNDFSIDMRKNIRKEKNSLEKLRRFADMSMAFLFLWILGLLVSSYMLTFNMEDFRDRMDTIMDMCLQLDLPIQASLRSRELLSHDPSAHDGLLFLSEEFQQHFSHLQIQSSLPRLEYLATPAQWWDFDGKHFFPTPTNALGLVSKMTTHVALLSQRLDINSSDSEFLSVYRNGAGDTANAFNVTMRKVMKKMNEMTSGNENTLKVLSVVGAVVFFMVCFCVNIIIWRKMRSLRNIVWHVLKSLPVYIYIAARSNSKTRLETTHGIDYEEMQSDHYDPTSRSKRMKLDKVATLPESKLLFATLLIFSGVFAYVVVEYFDDTISDSARYHQQLPALLYYSAVRTSELTNLFFYLKEATSNETYFSILQDHFSLFDLQNHFQAAVASLSFFENSLLFSTEKLDIQTLSMSAEHKAMVLGDSDPITPFLKYGTHATLTAMILDLTALDLTDSSVISMWQQHKETLHEALNNLTLLYRTDVEQDMQNMNKEHMMLMTVICLSMLTYYLIAIRYITTRIMKNVGAEWMILSYIPREACTEAIRLLKKG